MRPVPLVEIFASYQGEGPYVGAPQVFVRFARCNLRCAYCDTPEGLDVPPTYRREIAPFIGTYESRPNPCSLDECAEHLDRLGRASRFHAVAITGGEPLLHADYLAALLPRLRRSFPRTYLETNATLPEALGRVAGDFDIISLGVKLPSCPGVQMNWESAEACLRVAADAAEPPAAPNRARPSGRRPRDVFVKLVLTRETTPDEVSRVASLMASIRPETILILQPVTRVPDGPEPPNAERLRELLARATRCLDDVRILPQIHLALGWK
jgi:7-carboxy-7-deazaguanine synthase